MSSYRSRCSGCMYENQKSDEDPCFRCLNESEYVPKSGGAYSSYSTTKAPDFESIQPDPETEPVEEET